MEKSDMYVLGVKPGTFRFINTCFGDSVWVPQMSRPEWIRQVLAVEF
jgi:predicted metal-binding transcription factor (methanogenesis marker protein 9)